MASSYHVTQISRVRMNPYVRLLRAALTEAGISCSALEGLSPRHLPLRAGMQNILHLHWLELLYAAPSAAQTTRRVAAVLLGLVSAKARGCRVVYTLHNLSPHEQRSGWLNRVVSLMLFALTDGVHVHDEAAKSGAEKAYKRRDRIYVVPHGSYIGAYPNECSRQEARARLGLPDCGFVYLCLGQMRPYKGVEALIEAFGRLAGEDDYLVLAGHVTDPAYGEALAQLTSLYDHGCAEGERRIRTWFQYVPDTELQYFMNACDVCVLPYRDVTTSGAAVLAFSFGKPVIAPAIGGFPELVAGERGIVYDPNGSNGLYEALHRARLEDMIAAGERARVWAQEHEWRALVPSFVRMYEDVLGNRCSGRGPVFYCEGAVSSASHGSAPCRGVRTSDRGT